MGFDLNHVTFTGRLGGDATLKSVGKSGTALMQFSFAVTHGPKDHERTEWMQGVVWGPYATRLHESGKFVKGAAIVIAGRLEIDEYEAQDGGGKKKAVKVVADKAEVLDSGGTNGGGSDRGQGGQRQGGNRGAPGARRQPRPEPRGSGGAQNMDEDYGGGFDDNEPF